MRHRHVLLLVAITLLSGPTARAADAELRADAAAGLKKAVTFFHDRVAVEGGYVYRVSADLTLREGEGVTGPQTIWVQSPGTPAVGAAMLEAWELTRESYLLAAATDAGRALLRGQLHSGGWQDHVDFGPDDRRKLAYRADGKPGRKARNLSSFDDDKTQSALRFLIRLDRAHGFKDAAFHECARFALDAVLGAQHANGAWSQVWDGPSKRDDDPTLRASFPENPPKTYPGGDYWWHYTFNDNAMGDTVDTLLLAADVYDEPKYRDAAGRCGDFILRAQLPEPQPAWAQQYDREMHPAWARKFEPPAVSGGESQTLLRTLMRLYSATGDAKYLEPIPAALAWLERSALPDGRLARFYELKTNRPLYMTTAYELTYGDADLPTHYGFKVGSDAAALRKQYDRLKSGGAAKPVAAGPKRPAAATPESEKRVRAVLAAMDERGAWVEDGRLKYHRKDARVIESETFIRNVGLLSEYVASR